VTIHWLW